MDDATAHETLYAGDPQDRDEACTALYQRHAPWLIAALERKGVQAEFAEHGTCQALYKLFEKLERDGSFDSGNTDRLRRWLYKVGSDAAIDEMRRIWKLRSGTETQHASQYGADDDPPMEEGSTSKTAVLELVEAREVCRQLRDCIKDLKPDEKFILLSDIRVLGALREYGGLEIDLYDQDLASNASAGVALPGSLKAKRARILKKLLAKIGRSKDG